jgi:serine/threonine-protein kinase
MNSLPRPALDDVYVAFQSAVAGRYSIDRELGRGGMGIVYLAHEVHLDRLVAIKLLPPDKAADPSLRERFMQEARLAAKLSHPHIIPIHAVAEAGGFVFYVMAYIEGETLAHRVQTRGPLVGSEATRILREVSWALAHAHAQGLVHRDVKPDNILLEASSGRALVADFGIAAAMGEVAGHLAAGTPEFMSPEQASGTAVDARSDLYSLGATAFFAVSGRLPFEGPTAMAVLARHATEPVPSLATTGSAVPRKLALLIERCLAKAPDDRPASAESLADELGLTQEQRRELPVALRAFVKRSSRLDGGGTLIAGFALLTGSISIASMYGGRAGFAALILGAGMGKLAFFVNAARKLLRQGFTHADLAPAFQREREQISEELSVDRTPGMLMLERLLRPAAITGTTVFALTLTAGLTFPLWIEMLPKSLSVPTTRAMFAVLGTSAVIGFGTGIGYLALLQRRRDVDTEVWGRMWTGRLGKAVFAVARRFARRTTSGAAMTHRATEMSLGLAAEQLYEALPRETRDALRDVPGITQRLQDDARALRQHVNDLNAGLAGASGPEHGDLRERRDDVQRRLEDVVAALETIRLNLLRLHAGQSSVENLTTHLALAADVSEEVERLVSAHEEIDQSLRLPREVATTPA